MMEEVLRLSTGRRCVLRNPSLPFLASYHVLSFPHEQGAPSELETEDLLLVRPGFELIERSFELERRTP